MNAPNDSQRRILRLLAAGGELKRADRTQAKLMVNKTAVAIVRTGTLSVLIDNGWIVFDDAKERWTITPVGRGHAEVGAFVRAFSESQ